MGIVACLMALLLLLTVFFGVQTFQLSRQVKALTQSADSSGVVGTEEGSVEETDDSIPMEAESSSPELQEEGTQPTETVVNDANDADYPEYTTLFPELSVEPTPKVADDQQSVVYLTFDDGPSESNTRKLMDILDEYNVKATFFVTGQFGTVESRAALFQEILKRGHGLGLHTFSHEASDIYQSVEAYLTDLNAIYQEVYEATGEKISLLRFPGGSINSYNGSNYQELVAEVTRRGFTYTDWNVSADDAIGTPEVGEIIDQVVENCELYKKAIVLCHDTDQQTNTTNAISDIIEILSEEGYEFRAMDASVRPYHFGCVSVQ